MRQSSFDFNDKEAIQDVPKARFELPSEASKKPTLLSFSEGNETGIEGVVNPSPEAHGDLPPEGGECRNVLSGDMHRAKPTTSPKGVSRGGVKLEERVSEQEPTKKRKRGRPRGSKNKAKVVKVEVVNERQTPPSQVTPSTTKTTKKKKGITANQLPALMPDYSDIVHREELEVVIDSLPPYPHTIGGQAGWVACALNLVRKTGLNWEQWRDLNELAKGWVDIPASEVRHLIASFLKGYKLSEFKDINKGEALVNSVFYATEKLAWEEVESEAIIWVRNSLQVIESGARSVTSADLLKAWKAYHPEDKRSDRVITRMLKTSIPDAFPREAREGLVKFSTHAKRYFRGEVKVERARGWIGLDWEDHMERTVFSEECEAIDVEHRQRAEQVRAEQEEKHKKLTEAMNSTKRVFVDDGKGGIGWK